MNNNYNATQPAFTARLNIKGIQLNSKKLQEVEREFSRITEHYKTEELIVRRSTINGDYNGQFLHSVDFYTKNNSNEIGYYFPLGDFKKWFEEGSVKDIARGLARVFKVGKFQELQNARLGELCKNLRSAQNCEQINRFKSSLTGKAVYKKLAESNHARTVMLQDELSTTRNKYIAIDKQIKDEPFCKSVEFNYTRV